MAKPWDEDRPPIGAPFPQVQAWFDKWAETPGFWEDQVLPEEDRQMRRRHGRTA